MHQAAWYKDNIIPWPVNFGTQGIDKSPPIRSIAFDSRAQEYKIRGVVKASEGGFSPSYLGESYIKSSKQDLYQF